MRTKGYLRPGENKVVVGRKLADVACIAAALALVELLRPSGALGPRLLVVAVAALLFVVVGEIVGLYGSWRARSLREELWRALEAWMIVLPVVVVLWYASHGEEMERSWLPWSFAAPALVCGVRSATSMTLRHFRRQGWNTRNVAIVGATEVGVQLAAALAEQPETGLRLQGFFDDRAPGRRAALPDELGTVQGDIEDMLERARSGELDVVYFALPLRAEYRVKQLVEELADTTASVYLVPDFFGFELLRAEWSSLSGIPVVHLVDTPFYGADGWLKRVEDLVLGSMILTIIALPMLVIAAAIKLTSPGPVLFRQRRYGLNGERIRVLKFRTMTCCEDGPTIPQATRGDARVTKLGAFLRRTSLDELPQFLQVLTGHMSIVGPRPHAVAHNEHYRHLIHGYMRRHKVKPGITGWAQVNGWRGETDTLEKMQKRVEHDLEYIERWSLLWDLEIIARTVVAAAGRRNAY